MRRVVEAPLHAFIGLMIGAILVGIGLGGIIFR